MIARSGVNNPTVIRMLLFHSILPCVQESPWKNQSEFGTKCSQIIMMMSIVVNQIIVLVKHLPYGNQVNSLSGNTWSTGEEESQLSTVDCAMPHEQTQCT